MEGKNRNTIVSAIKGCENRENVIDLFSNYTIEDNEEKIDLLKAAMGSPEFYNSSEMTPEEEVHRLISILLTGNWKVNELYERAGF